MDIYSVRYAVRFLIFSLLACGLTSAAFAQRGGGGMMPSTPFDPHDVSGYWELGPDGKSVPAADLTPAAKEAMNKVAEEDMVSYRWCRPLGLPAMMDNGRPIAIQQGKWELLMTTEANSSPRHIYTNRPQHIDPNIFDPSSVGDSIAMP